MQPRSIEKRAACGAGILVAAVLAAACSDDAPQDPVDAAPMDASPGDAGPSEFAVRGSASGVLGPVALELRRGSDVEPLTVSQDGAFAFAARLEAGDSYTVTLVDEDAPCTLDSATGVIAGADAAIELSCTGPALTSVVVSGIAPAVAVAPGTIDYVVELPLSQPAVTLTATVATAGDTLTIAGAPVASGAPSAELALALGDNPVDIVVENAIGWQRTYRLTLRRAAQLAQYAYGKASNTGVGDSFGGSVALSGDTLAVGAVGESSASQGIDGDQDDNSSEAAGAVYVFRRTGASWQQEAYLKASNAERGDQFGVSVALSGDTLAVGAWSESSASGGVNGDQDDDSAATSGAVYVFRRTGTSWQQEAYVKASNIDAGDTFGVSVALSGDTLAVGAPFEGSASQGVDGDEDDDSAASSGAVYVFRRTGTSWQQEAYVKASNSDANDEFGSSVALSGDTLAVGAYQEDSASEGVGGAQDDDSAADSGAVYVFRRTGATWQQEAYLKASNTDAGDQFGFSVALSGDALAVGAFAEDSASRGVDGAQDDDSASGSGAVYVFRHTGTTWQQEAYVKASNADAGDLFGFSVALAGGALAVGARGEYSASRGVDGDQDDDSAISSGAVYLFRRTGTTWQQQAYVKASNTGIGDELGDSVALSGDTLAAGAQREDSASDGVNSAQDDDSASQSGAVYIFH
jgi:hypothetical protein